MNFEKLNKIGEKDTILEKKLCLFDKKILFFDLFMDT